MVLRDPWISGDGPAVRDGTPLEGLGVQLADDRRVVIKARQADPRLADCFAVQSDLHAEGFPCPRPILGPTAFGGLVATVEEYVAGGVRLDATRSIDRFAALLARLVRSAPPAQAVPALLTTPPWVNWGHPGPDTWPLPDDLPIDLNAHPGPAWVDDAGARLRQLLANTGLPSVVGHLDWESQNLRWTEEGEPLCVDDWDSLGALPEPAVAGAAAAVFPSSADGTTVMATIRQTEQFLASYQAARSEAWGLGGLSVAWAAGTWVLAYNAKKEANGGGAGYIGRLREEIPERLRRSGI